MFDPPKTFFLTGLSKKQTIIPLMMVVYQKLLKNSILFNFEKIKTFFFTVGEKC